MSSVRLRVLAAQARALLADHHRRDARANGDEEAASRTRRPPAGGSILSTRSTAAGFCPSELVSASLPDGCCASRFLANAVSHAAHGGDELGAELFTERADIDLDDVRTGVEIVAPDAREDLLARQHLSGMAKKKL